MSDDDPLRLYGELPVINIASTLSDEAYEELRLTVTGYNTVRAANILPVAELLKFGLVRVKDYYDDIQVEVTEQGRDYWNHWEPKMQALKDV